MQMHVPMRRSKIEITSTLIAFALLHGIPIIIEISSSSLPPLGVHNDIGSSVQQI